MSLILPVLGVPLQWRNHVQIDALSCPVYFTGHDLVNGFFYVEPIVIYVSSYCLVVWVVFFFSIKAMIKTVW